MSLRVLKGHLYNRHKSDQDFGGVVGCVGIVGVVGVVGLGEFGTFGLLGTGVLGFGVVGIGVDGVGVVGVVGIGVVGLVGLVGLGLVGVGLVGLTGLVRGTVSNTALSVDGLTPPFPLLAILVSSIPETVKAMMKKLIFFMVN